MADQKQHAKITQQVRDLYKALNDCVSHSGSLQILADALRDVRLDEAKMFVSEMERCHPRHEVTE